MNSQDTPTAKGNPMARVMSLRNFRLLLAGAATSLLGDQFVLIATPWLVLKLTSDPMALGVVLALEGIPRALVMLLGGAVTDRLSPRLMMLTANVVRLCLTAVMAFLVFTGTAQLWMIYTFSILFGIVAGFAIPAENSIVPMLVDEGDLQAGNSVIMGITQLAGFVGPTIAGILIGRFSGSYTGTGVAFALDAFTFLVSAVTLQLIRTGKQVPTESEKESVLASIRSAVRYVWSSTMLRSMFIVLTVANFLVVGPITVGIPVLADSRLAEGAAAFGLLMSAFAGGNLLGYVLSGALRRPTGFSMQVIMVSLFAAFGAAIGSLGFISSTWIDFGLLFFVGLGNGYMAVILFTWIQTKTPAKMLGRVMSFLMLCSTGLVPISQAISGAISKWNLSSLFVVPGILMLGLTLWIAMSSDLRNLSMSLTAVPLEKGEVG